MKSRQRAFTLIELLVVIVIIGILAGLLFPAVNGALENARRVQAQNDVTQLAIAVSNYETEYGRLPDVEDGEIDSDLVDILIGQDTDKNPRGVVFIEVSEAKGRRSGTNASGNYVDPWGGTYQIALDADYDNALEGVGPDGDEDLRKKVAVWSTNEKDRLQVRSW